MVFCRRVGREVTGRRGRGAWWFWLALHIYFLIEFRSRLIVLINWAWAYFTYVRGARIILGTPNEDTVDGRKKEGNAEG